MTCYIYLLEIEEIRRGTRETLSRCYRRGKFRQFVVLKRRSQDEMQEDEHEKLGHQLRHHKKGYNKLKTRTPVALKLSLNCGTCRGRQRVTTTPKALTHRFQLLPHPPKTPDRIPTHDPSISYKTPFTLSTPLRCMPATFIFCGILNKEKQILFGERLQEEQDLSLN